MYFDWVIIFWNKERGTVFIDNFYDSMFSVSWEVETIGL